MKSIISGPVEIDLDCNALGNENIVAYISEHIILGKLIFLFNKDRDGTLHVIGYYSANDNNFHKLSDEE